MIFTNKQKQKIVECDCAGQIVTAQRYVLETVRKSTVNRKYEGRKGGRRRFEDEEERK